MVGKACPYRTADRMGFGDVGLPVEYMCFLIPGIEQVARGETDLVMLAQPSRRFEIEHGLWLLIHIRCREQRNVVQPFTC